MKKSFKLYTRLALASFSLIACTATLDNVTKDKVSDALSKTGSSSPTSSAAPTTGSSTSPTSSAAPTTGSSTSPTSSAAPTTGSSTSPTSSAAPTTGSSTSPTSSAAPTTGSTGWSILKGEFPCTDKAAMLWEDRNKVYWGCGKSGRAGLHTSTDGGKTFALQTKLAATLIQGITRAPDGSLYVSGKLGVGPVAKINESNPTRLDYTELYQRGSNAFTTVEQGENVAVTADGQILVDSLTGTNAVYSPGNNAAGKEWFTSTCTGKDASTYKPDATNTFCELHGVGEEILADPKATAYQITALQQMNDKFYATGYQIDKPAQVRLPSKLPGATYHFQTVTFQKANENGSMTGLYVWPNGRIITVGTDMAGMLPLIYVCEEGKDCYQASNWTDVELDLFGFKYADSARDGRAVSANGDNIVVVGNFVPNAKGGWAVQSTDGGKNWVDLTPKLAALGTTGKVDMLYNVQVFKDGTIMLFGEKNFIYTP